MRAGAKTPGKTPARASGPARKVARRAGLIGVAVAILATVVAWWLMQPAGEGLELQAAAPAFPWSRAPAVLEPPLAAETPLMPSTPALPAEPVSGRATPAGPTAFDLCGMGRIVVAGVPPAPSAPSAREGGPLAELPAPVGRFALQEAQARVALTLGAGDARQRVAARLLQSPADDDPAAQAAWARGLLADALATGDAQALRWAGAACPFVEDELQCSRRLARARVRAEPANALHWLDWAQAEPEAADAAWAGLARAQYWRELPLGLAGAAMGALSADVPGYLQATLAMEAMARDAAFPAPPLSLALERCAAKPGGAAQGSECERLARLLVERGDSVQALMLGRELGEHIGWPPEQLRRLDDEVQALQKQEVQWSIDERRPLGCETVEGQRGHIAAVEREGELAVLRRNLAAERARR